ncbi:cas scaffolding protein family member 4 [Embiotoca jacksoni]|uniref:cas scaffolding protein family member 4 n=1 Tax=Embiotoca jacksoni TaxID=100190 RepID=UPI003704A3F3
MNQLAKALYDNTAECADELAFRKGDIVTVMDQNVVGTSGWWMCSLYGRHGLAPANRLKLLPQTGTTTRSFSHVVENPTSTHAKTDDRVQNIYQIPSVPRPTSSPAYECMDVIYKVPSIPLSASKSPIPPALWHSTEGPEGNKPSFSNYASSPKGEVYDVPNQARRASLFTESTSPRQMLRKSSLIPVSKLDKKFDSLESLRCSSPGDTYVYAVPPPLPQDPNYDIPVPSAAESQLKMSGGFSTISSPHKLEWIYDVPVGPEKQSPLQGSYDILPSKTFCRSLYDIPPAHALPIQRDSPTPLLYDIPKPSCLDIPSPLKVQPRAPLCDRPPTQSLTEELHAVPPKEEPLTRVVSDLPSDHKPLECRGDSNNTYELKRVRLQRMRNFLACTSFRDLQGTGESLVPGDERGRVLGLSAADSQRISTASSSSTSSCDSLALSSSSPEPLREVTLCQDEASRKLLDLQESVFRAVPRLMDFVSSRWRCKEHLEKHLKEIKEAAEGIACALMCFLNFALDVKGNARRLTDVNLQTRLYKQLSIIEDSGVILQQTVSGLNMAGWPLNTLCQDPGQVQTPDQLDRFVMVARTVPEDVKRLVSITNANGKLLFRAPQKDPESVNTTSSPETKKSPDGTEQREDLVEDDNDYVELQVKASSLKNSVQGEQIENITPVSQTAEGDNSSDSGNGAEEHQANSLSEHCRLYFGALQKAIGGFVGSLQNGQPPEKFISQSKLVIMVGQRLMDTLCKEAQRGGSSQGLLCKSNQLCALLKQLAVATKKAALHFPDQQALHEAQEFAKELAQGAQHFRISLDL